MSKLYVVGTPIGNMGDITKRALEVLKSVDLILCEDTRVTKKLLNKYDIETPTLSYHSHSKISKIDKIIEKLKGGSNLALVSDAGTPTISDPGSYLISEIKKELGDGVEIVAIPGPSAVISALSISGLVADKFSFFGFLPHKKGRQTLIKKIADSEITSVFYESPHRLLRALGELKEVLGENREVVVAKELTKIFEETVSGDINEVLEFFENNQDKIKGEFVILVSAYSKV